jgi:hypothetical protein
MTEKQFYEFIGEATVNNLIVTSGNTGAKFTTSEICGMNVKGLKGLYDGLPNPTAKKRLGDTDKIDPNSVEAQLALIEAVYNWKIGEEKREETAKAERKAAEKKLAMFSKITNKAEEDRIAGLSPEALQAEIAAAQMIVEAKSFI